MSILKHQVSFRHGGREPSKITPNNTLKHIVRDSLISPSETKGCYCHNTRSFDKDLALMWKSTCSFIHFHFWLYIFFSLICLYKQEVTLPKTFIEETNFLFIFFLLPFFSILFVTLTSTSEQSQDLIIAIHALYHWIIFPG